MTMAFAIMGFCIVFILGMTLAILLLPLFSIVAAIALTVFLFVFWIWMLVDCIRNPNIGSTEKVIWAIVIALTHFIGALIYFIVSRVRSPRVGMRATI